MSKDVDDFYDYLIKKLVPDTANEHCKLYIESVIYLVGDIKGQWEVEKKCHTELI